MKTYIKTGLLSIGLTFLMAAPLASAASPPPLGATDSFSILAGTYSNTALGTTINGDLGYTTPPATTPTVNGNTHVADATYNQAGIDQGTALSNLNSQPCTFSFAPGAIDLASDTTHGVVGVYNPGVYCISGAATIGGGATITLTGAGTYIFRMTGALTSTDNSVIAVSGGAAACNLWWTPGAAATLGANSIFGGNIIDASGITTGHSVTWTGRALAFGGTVSTSSDTISSTTCSNGSSSANSQSLAAASAKPGLPNTGLSQPMQTNSVKYFAVLGIISAGMILAPVLAIRKRV